MWNHLQPYSNRIQNWSWFHIILFKWRDTRHASTAMRCCAKAAISLLIAWLLGGRVDFKGTLTVLEISYSNIRNQLQSNTVSKGNPCTNCLAHSMWEVHTGTSHRPGLGTNYKSNLWHIDTKIFCLRIKLVQKYLLMSPSIIYCRTVQYRAFNYCFIVGMSGRGTRATTWSANILGSDLTDPNPPPQKPTSGATCLNPVGNIPCPFCPKSGGQVRMLG